MNYCRMHILNLMNSINSFHLHKSISCSAVAHNQRNAAKWRKENKRSYNYKMYKHANGHFLTYVHKYIDIYIYVNIYTCAL